MLKKVFLLISLLLTAKQFVMAESFYNEKYDENWNMVWQDEFDGEKLDANKWRHETGNGFWSGTTWIEGWGNQELEYYTDREKNVRLENGLLVIEAKKEKYKGQYGDGEKTYHYTSGKIKSKDLFSKKYGRFEMRAKFPVGKGLWPAMWMLPQDDIYGGWATSGEIDIFEGWGSKASKVSGTLHYGSTWPSNVHTGADYDLENSTIAEFHDYAVEWLPGEIRWYIDGEVYQVQNNWYAKNNSEAVNYTYPAPFDQDFYMIFNLAVGGWFDGEPDKKTEFPAKMEVDYIRVYDLEDGYDENIMRPETDKDSLPNNAKEAIEGNYIYNGNFAEGKSEWELLSHFGGSAKYSFEDVDGSKFLKASISKGGEQEYSVQIIQEAPVMKGHWYKMSFDAKAAKDRALTVKIGGGEERKWKAYHKKEFNLTDSVNNFITVFQMTDESDINTKVEFHAGLSTDDVWLGDVKLELVENPEEEINNMGKLPLANGNQIYNGTIDQGETSRMQFWMFDAEKQAAVGVNSERQLVVEADGNSAELYQTNLPLLKDSVYNLKFKASSDNAEKIRIMLTDESGSKTYTAQEIELTNEAKDYEVKLDYAYATDLNSRFVIDLSEAKGAVIFDNFFMKKAVDYSNIETVLISDDFSDSKTKKQWTAWMGKEFGFGGEFDFKYKKEQARLTVRDLGSEMWSNLLSQNANLQKGLKYRLSFDISSSRKRQLTVALENNSYQRSTAKTLKTDKKTQHVDLEFVAERSEEVGLKFLFGKYPKASKRAHYIYLDNVELVVVQE